MKDRKCAPPPKEAYDVPASLSDELRKARLQFGGPLLDSTDNLILKESRLFGGDFSKEKVSSEETLSNETDESDGRSKVAKMLKDPLFSSKAAEPPQLCEEKKHEEEPPLGRRRRKPKKRKGNKR